MNALNDDQISVELYISCRSLQDKDLLGKSDPKVKAFMQKDGQWTKIGKTERINNNLNPEFRKTIKADFVFETKQPIRFDVTDIDKQSGDDLIGCVETTLGEIMGARKQTVTLQLISKSNKPAGSLIVRGDKVGASRNQVVWQWSGLNLINLGGCFGKSSPFLRFSKQNIGGEWIKLHETEVTPKNLNPTWKSFKIGDDKLCGTDHSKPVRVECLDYKEGGAHKLIGVAEITLEKLKNGEVAFNLMNPTANKSQGILRLTSFALHEIHTFVDFLRGGEQLNAVVAIDFTGSNGDPKNPTSLHARFKDGKLNEYQQTITSVCQTVLNYDYDQKVPVFGFGGKPHFAALNSHTVSHCFPCSGNVQDSQVLGVKGILDIYSHALDHVDLSGPTYFAPIIKETVKACEINKQNEADIYSILLILTDGEIHDMEETVELLVSAAHLPISVIIVGIGAADFTKMEILDGDSGLVNSKGIKSARDFVQFVSFRKFKNDMYLLSKHVLAEAPKQLVEYKKLIGQKPKPPLY